MWPTVWCSELKRRGCRVRASAVGGCARLHVGSEPMRVDAEFDTAGQSKAVCARTVTALGA
jgi:hypothetical protein